MKVQTVQDVIDCLKTFPPDMEVWVTWDESGEYWPAKTPMCRVDWVVQHTNRKGVTRWEYSEEQGVGKPVCMLEPCREDGNSYGEPPQD